MRKVFIGQSDSGLSVSAARWAPISSLLAPNISWPVSFKSKRTHSEGQICSFWIYQTSLSLQENQVVSSDEWWLFSSIPIPRLSPINWTGLRSFALRSPTICMSREVFFLNKNAHIRSMTVFCVLGGKPSSLPTLLHERTRFHTAR